MKIEIKREGDHDLLLPFKATKGSAGFDLSCVKGFYLEIGEKQMVKCGFSYNIPDTHCGIIKPRSGLAGKKGVDILAGIIDSDFRGEVRAILVNHGNQKLKFEAGDRIAQMIIVEVPELEFVEVAELYKTDRGDGGFGSTGK